MDRLKIWVRSKFNISAVSFKNLPDKLSILPALFMLQFFRRSEMYFLV